MKRLITLCIICFSLVAKASVPYEHVVVFGDSLSDNGNSYERTQHYIPQTPPYYQGRFSDGPVWIEFLSESLSSKSDFLQDYALGGAGVTAEDEDIDGLFTLANQVKDYLDKHNQQAEQDSLFVIWIGANNYLILPDDEEGTVETVKAGTYKAIEKLRQAGAKHFLILNLPELSKTPFAKYVDEDDYNKLSRYTHNHNKMLESLVEEYREKYSDIDWHFYDIHSMFNKVLVNPEMYGFTNIVDTCFDEEDGTNLRLQPVIRVEKLFKIEPPRNCDSYLFFDPVHPTGRAHKVFAQQLLTDLANVFEKNAKA